MQVIFHSTKNQDVKLCLKKINSYLFWDHLDDLHRGVIFMTIKHISKFALPINNNFNVYNINELLMYHDMEKNIVCNDIIIELFMYYIISYKYFNVNHHKLIA